ncbi:hypothetical protein Q3C01_00660 [Bradyrhizobium sp. UFLA05-109]
MAFEYWWIGLFVDEREHALIQPHFAAAEAKSVLPAEARHGLEAATARRAGFLALARPQI